MNDTSDSRLLQPLVTADNGDSQEPVRSEATRELPPAGLLKAAVMMALMYPNYAKYFLEAARKPAGGNQ